jgi:TolB-like protein/DNA-binding winged helix-turn-helix (wHTH) protein
VNSGLIHTDDSLSSGAITDVVEFSGFRLERGKRRLTGPEGMEIPLTPKAFNTLAYLAAHPGEVLDKQALFDAVWPGVVVEENNLNQAVSALRRALGDNPQDPRFIATVPRRGYRFVAPVRFVGAADDRAPRAAPAASPFAGGGTPEPAHTLAAALRTRHGRARTFGALAVIALVVPATLALWRADVRPAPANRTPPAESAAATATAPATVAKTPAAAAAGASLAVLPFRNLSADPDEELFADGLSEELINRLEQVQGLRVIGRTSSFVYKNHDEDLRGIGEALGVRSLLEGSVRKGQGRLRVAAQLIDASTGFVRWSQTYDRAEGNALAIQEDIARAAVDALSAALGAEEARDPFFGLGPKSFA